jgi:hypothetical protein
MRIAGYRVGITRMTFAKEDSGGKEKSKEEREKRLPAGKVYLAGHP